MSTIFAFLSGAVVVIIVLGLVAITGHMGDPDEPKNEPIDSEKEPS